MVDDRPAKRARRACNLPLSDQAPKQATYPRAPAQLGDNGPEEQPPAASQPRHHDFVFDDKGDLTLIVDEGEEQKRMKVCSRTLARHSPVFKTMLFGDWAESRPSSSSQHWEVELPDDPWTSIHSVLNIVHGKFEQVEELQPGLEALYDILSLTNKYDMTSTLRPWARKWLERSIRRNRDPFLLFAAWELGCKSIFSDTAKTIAYSCRADPDDQRLYVKHGLRKIFLDEYEYLVPPQFIESISAFRSKALHRIFTVLNISWNVLSGKELVAEDGIVHGCACSPSGTMSLLGVFVATACKAGLLPYLDMRPPAQVQSIGFTRPLFSDSVYSLLIKIDVVWQVDKRLSHKDAEGLCGFQDELKLADHVAMAVKDWDLFESDILDHEVRATYIRCLDAQQQKSGF